MKWLERRLIVGLSALAICLLLAAAANAGPRDYYYDDADNDGYGDPATEVYTNHPPAGYITAAGDCNDGNNLINPGAAEICDSVDLTDENCSGAANEGCLTWWEDQDNDAYSTGLTAFDTSAPAGYVAEATLASTTLFDCNDALSAVNPGAAEICDSVDPTDENCSGVVNEGCLTWWEDQDNDAYSSGISVYDFSAPGGYVAEATLASTTVFDCNDSLASINPGTVEICDTVDLTDENCSGAANEGCQTWWEDQDHDTFTTGANLYDQSAPSSYVPESTLTNTTFIDCDDNDSAINPYAVEILGDVIDQNCDGAAFFADGNLDACAWMATYLATGNPEYDPLAFYDLTGLDDCWAMSINVLDGIELLTNLTYLDLHANEIIDISNLAGLQQLTYLDLEFNQITDATPVENLPALTYLNLNYNGLWNYEYPNLINPQLITHLGLASAHIIDHTPLANFPNLQWLDLTGNNFSDLTPIANFTDLNTLILYYNGITDLSPLANLSQLTYLDIADNSLTDLNPLSSSTHPLLDTIYLEQNCLEPDDFDQVSYVPNLNGATWQKTAEQCM